ncbi:MAG: family 16 glycosylhydrolase [Flavobacteriales bacterium]|nr:family 16 glycosylhydrolase [Flavobacteriales bacterium]
MRTILLLILLFPLSLIAQNWSLVWSDEFDGNTLNSDNWVYDIGTGSQFGLTGWGNNEAQYYTSSTNNVFVQDGLLTIRAIPQNVGGMNYTSGRIKSLNKQYWTYGKIEARIQLPGTQGIWPAFWMLPQGQFWPGEIDIMEIIGSQPNVLHGTTHSGTTDNVVSIGGSYTHSESLTNNFHTYAIEWWEDNIVWYFDDIEYFRINRSELPEGIEWLYAQDYYLLLNVAVGGNWPGYPDGSTSFPAEMLVDYVRVYEATPSNHSVTFNVDMESENLSPSDQVYVTGSFNDWCATCNLMTNGGNNIWTTSIDLAPGIHEYKFIVNDWSDSFENWTSSQPCTLTTIDNPNVYINRFVNVPFEDYYIPTVCFNTCDNCEPAANIGCTNPQASNFNASATLDDGSCLFAVQLHVNMNNTSLNPGDMVNVNGTFNSWCGACNPMNDPEDDGVYSTTLFLPNGTHEYKFTTNGWNGLIEQFDVGESCTMSTIGEFETFTNRFVQVSSAPIEMDIVCFDECALCPLALPEQTTITFTVDGFNNNAQSYSLEYSQMDVSETISMNHIGWGLYQVQVSLLSDTPMIFRFVGDGAVETPKIECFLNGFRNFTPSIGGNNFVSLCFDQCESCDGCLDPLASNFNPYSNGNGNCIGNLIPGCTYPEASNFAQNANLEDGSCVFDTSNETCLGDLNQDNVINASDLLTFLSQFGTECD